MGVLATRPRTLGGAAHQPIDRGRNFTIKLTKQIKWPLYMVLFSLSSFSPPGFSSGSEVCMQVIKDLTR